MKKYIFHITGTHCASCKILVEDILKEQEIVKRVQVNLKKEKVINSSLLNGNDYKKKSMAKDI